jgi:hypothetical protein
MKRPFFNKDKYSEYCLKSPELSANIVLGFFNQDSPDSLHWYDKFDGEEMIQYSRHEFVLRNKKKRYFSFMEEWVEWRKRK